jgi:hypothetical protein
VTEKEEGEKFYPGAFPFPSPIINGIGAMAAAWWL